MSHKDKKTTTEKRVFDAVTMRIILVVVLIAILLLMGGGFYLAYTSLEKTAKEVSEVQTQAQTSDAKLQNLALLEKQLKENSIAVDRAKQIVADSQSYQYQNQIINDLTYYANQAHISITSFTFQDSTAAASSSSSSTSSSSTSSTNSTLPASTVNGVKSTQVAIQLGGNVAYQDFLHFLYLIEQNLTRMQVADVTMSKGDDPNTVSAQSLNIEVYIR